MHTMAESIVVSKMITRFGQCATIGMPPVGRGHARSVVAVSQAAKRSPATPAAPAIQNIHVARSRWLNRCPSNGSDEMTVISASATPASCSRSTAACAASGSEKRA